MTKKNQNSPSSIFQSSLFLMEALMIDNVQVLYLYIGYNQMNHDYKHLAFGTVISVRPVTSIISVLDV